MVNRELEVRTEGDDRLNGYGHRVQANAYPCDIAWWQLITTSAVTTNQLYAVLPGSGCVVMMSLAAQ